MKKIIFSFLFLFSYLLCNAQVDSIYISVHHMKDVYHLNKNCSHINEGTGQMYILNITNINSKNFKNYVEPCKHCVSKINDQLIRNTVKYNTNVINEDPKNLIESSGKYLMKSANCQYIALGFVIASGISATLPAIIDDNSVKYEDGATPYYIVAGVFGVAALITECIGINYKFKSGKSLKLSAGKIRYNF